MYTCYRKFPIAFHLSILSFPVAIALFYSFLERFSQVSSRYRSARSKENPNCRMKAFHYQVLARVFFPMCHTLISLRTISISSQVYINRGAVNYLVSHTELNNLRFCIDSESKALLKLDKYPQNRLTESVLVPFLFPAFAHHTVVYSTLLLVLKGTKMKRLIEMPSNSLQSKPCPQDLKSLIPELSIAGQLSYFRISNPIFRPHPCFFVILITENSDLSLHAMISPVEAFRMVLSVVYVCPVCKKSFVEYEEELAHYRAAHTNGIYDKK
ncbi:hypothetical protein O181_014634 [Austropuccinia psidii MF-1]|uniref:C2H2-type domain-containing protein n=1 Tax=Austropuccinia psidii MF-1 TaxID=1389203 RepID=A0A9Q3C0G0_9BASI|nr:hypothetical protein [Austropuccinia psidii MF-1]